jgi:hypothetical protein
MGGKGLWRDDMDGDGGIEDVQLIEYRDTGELNT